MRLEYRWQVLAFALIMQVMVVGIGVYCFAFFVVEWVGEFGASRSELMLGYTGMTLMAGMLLPLAGFLIDRYHNRWVVAVGVAAYTLGLIAVSLAPTAVAVVLVFWLVMPLGMALAGPLMAQTLVAQAFVQKRGMALGISALGSSIGGLIMPLIATTMLTHMAWRPTVAALGVAISVLILPLAFLVIRNPPKLASHSDNRPAVTTREMLGNRDVYLLAVAAVVPSSLFVAVLQNVGLYARDLAISQQQAGVIVGGASVLMAAGKFTSGFLADRIRHHHIYYAQLGLAALGMTIVATSTSFYPLASGILLLAATAAGVMPLIGVAAGRRFGIVNFGRAIGIVMGIGSLSGVAPLAAGLMRDLSGSYEIAFLMLVPLVLPALVCFAFFQRRRLML